MKIQLMNTPLGLKPLYPEDFDEMKKLKVGTIYEAEIKTPRNYRFLRKFFALINVGYAYLPGDVQDYYFKSVDGFRKSVLISAGFVRTFWNIKEQTFMQEAESISFGNMDEAKFSDCYNRCRDVIYALVSEYVTEDEFEKTLLNF